MLDRRHLVALFEDVIGLGEAALDVAEAQFLVIVDVVIDERVLGIGLVDDGRAWFQRLLDVEHRGQRLVIDPHLRHRLKGLSRAVGDDGDDRLALVAHLVDRERRLVVLAEVDQAEQRVEIDRHVGAANDAANAGRAFRFGGVDAAQAGMGVRAAQYLEMQHALQLVVVEIGRGAGDMPEHVLALRALADFLQIIVALVGEDVLAQFQHGRSLQARARPPVAAARTALMIGS